MNPFRLLWQVMTGADSEIIEQHDEHIGELERQAQDAEDNLKVRAAIRAFDQMVKDSRR